jgi:HEAT repeat protein
MKSIPLLTTVLAVLTACGTPEVAKDYRTKTYVPEELQAALASRDPSARADAAAQVEAMSGGQRQAVLLELTTDPRPTVRLLAVGLAGKHLHGDEQAVARLAEMLSLDSDQDVRIAAVAALGETGSGPALTALLEALGNDTSLFVRRAAALALDRLTGQDFGAELAARVDEAEAAADGAMMNYEGWFDANRDALR